MFLFSSQCGVPSVVFTLLFESTRSPWSGGADIRGRTIIHEPDRDSRCYFPTPIQSTTVIIKMELLFDAPKP